jgi:hypothetical protein
MSRDRRHELQLRRERVLIRSAELRLQVARQANALVTPFALADQAVSGLRWLREHPAWPLSALALWIVLKPRRALRWAARGWWLWRTGQQLRRLWLTAGSGSL